MPESNTPITDRAARERLRGLHKGFSNLTFTGSCTPDEGLDGALFAEGDDFERDIVATTQGIDDHAAEPLMELIAAALNALPSLLAALDAAEARADRAEGDQRALSDIAERAQAHTANLEGLVKDIIAEAGGSCVMPAPIEYARERAYDAIHKLQDDKEAAESALAALRAEAEGLRARLELALLAIRLGFHAERFVVGDDGVTRYSCCGREYVCPDPFVNDHAKDCKPIQFATAAEAAAKKEGV